MTSGDPGGSTFRQLTPESLQELLTAPSANLRIGQPSLDDCPDFVSGSAIGSFGPMKRRQFISNKPGRDLVALRNSLSEVMSHWTAVAQHPMPEHLADPEFKRRLGEDMERRIF